MPFTPIGKLPLPCAVALLLCACGAREAAPAADGATTPAAPLETATEPGPDVTPVQAAPAGRRAAGQEAEPLPAYRALGTEPFWNVRVEGDALHFTTPEDMDGRRFTGTHTLRADGIRYTGDDSGIPFELDIRRGECSDGMSDIVYGFEATFRYGDTTYRGCAERAKAK